MKGKHVSNNANVTNVYGSNTKKDPDNKKKTQNCVWWTNLKILADKSPNMKVGQNIRLKVPDIDRAKTDPKSIIAVVVDAKDNEVYQLGTKIGVLKQPYP